MPRIRLSPTASITPTGAGVLLRSDLGTFQIGGADVSAFLDRVVPLLDGSRDEAAVVAALPDYSPASVAAFLELLRQRGLVENAPDAAARWHGPHQFLRSWPTAPPDTVERLARAHVLAVGLPPWGVAAAVELAAAGLGALHLIGDDAAATAARIGAQAPWCRVAASPNEALASGAVMAQSEPFTLLLAAIGAGQPEVMERVARLAHATQVPSLWSELTGSTAVLGPLVTPAITACRLCAADGSLNPRLPRGHAARWAGSMAELLGHVVAMEALQLITAYAPSELGGRLRTMDLTTHESTLHTLVRMPRCRVCGESD